MNDTDKNPISKKGPAKRDPACLQVLRNIVIPAGTILRQESGKVGAFSCPVAFGKFLIETSPAQNHPDTFKQVIA